MTEYGARDRFIALFGPIFRNEDRSASRIDEVLASLQMRELPAGADVIREGQVCASIPFVLEGCIRVFKSALSGREITLYRIEPGQSCILSLGCGGGLPYFPASAVAERSTIAAFIPRPTVRKLFAQDSAFADHVLEQYSRRLAEVIELVEEVAFRHVDERLHQWISSKCAFSPERYLASTHQELADNLGTSREVVSRILKDWEDRGAVEISRGGISLLSGFESLHM